jgi:hypothetical protein
MSDVPPWQVSAQFQKIDIVGHVIPWRDDQPVMMMLTGTTDWFLPVFASVEKLRELMAATKTEYDSFKQVDDQPEFLKSIPPETLTGERIRIMVDPYITRHGTTRFREIIR